VDGAIFGVLPELLSVGSSRVGVGSVCSIQPQPSLLGQLAGSGASVGSMGAAGGKAPCYAWAGGGHITRTSRKVIIRREPKDHERAGGPVMK
jgi:hypothetical protein